MPVSRRKNRALISIFGCWPSLEDEKLPISNARTTAEFGQYFFAKNVSVENETIPCVIKTQTKSLINNEK